MRYVIKFVPNTSHMPVRYNVDRHTAVANRDMAKVYDKCQLDEAVVSGEARAPDRFFNDQIEQWVSYSTEFVEVSE